MSTVSDEALLFIDRVPGGSAVFFVWVCQCGVSLADLVDSHSCDAEALAGRRMEL